MNKAIPARNHSIDICRLLLAIFIVACHADIFIDINMDLYNLIPRYLVRFIVVFFLMVSGYFYISDLIANKANFKQWLLTLFKTYLLWSLIYYSISFVTSVIIDKTPIDVFLIQRVKYFFFDGSFYHLWYIVALIYSLIAVTFVYRFFKEKGLLIFSIISIVLNIISAFITAYSFIGQNIPIISDLIKFSEIDTLVLIFGIGFSSFSAGYLILLIKVKKIITPKMSLIFFIIASILHLIEAMYLVLVMNSIDNPKVFFSMYLYSLSLVLFCLDRPMTKFDKFGAYSRKTAAFVYYIHPLILLGFNKVFEFLNLNIGSILLTLSTLLTCLVLAYICNRFDNNIFRYLLGFGGKKK